jgi:hypothetical protein
MRYNGMKRCLFNIFAAVSLLVCIYCAAVVVMHPDWSYVMFLPLGPERPYTAQEMAAYRPPTPAFELAGFRIQRALRVGSTICEGRAFSVPYWFLMALWGVVPIRWFRAWGKQRRRRRLNRLGLCMQCGYDLRASKERCPECGAAISGV